MNYKQAIVVREDIKMSPGKMAVQVGHACIGCAMIFFNASMTPDGCDLRDSFDTWFNEGQKKIVLRVPDLESLLKVQAKAINHNLPHYLVTDFGLTELDPGTITCLGIGPCSNEEIKPITGRIKLW